MQVPMDYKIHGSTIFIKGNGIWGHYKLNGKQVLKLTEHINGDQLIDKFHTLGELPLNSEAMLLNELHEQQLIRTK